MHNNNRLKNKTSYFQTKASKKPYKNTANYQNSIQQNRIDPKVFSVYKILDEHPSLTPPIVYELYVEDTYVEDGYIEKIPQ